MRKIGLFLVLALTALPVLVLAKPDPSFAPNRTTTILFDSGVASIDQPGLRAIIVFYLPGEIEGLTKNRPPGQFSESEERDRQLAIRHLVMERDSVTVKYEKTWRQKVFVVMIAALVHPDSRQSFKLMLTDECGIRRGQRVIKCLAINQSLIAYAGATESTYIIFPAIQLKPDDVFYLKLRNND